MIDAQFRHFKIHAEDLKPRRKTRDYTIIGNSGHCLGTIKWYGTWRQYCFFPEAQTLWSSDCLFDVRSFMAELMKGRVKQF